MQLTEKQVAVAKEFFDYVNTVLTKNGLSTAFDMHEEIDANGEKEYKFRFSVSTPSINVVTDKKQEQK